MPTRRTLTAKEKAYQAQLNKERAYAFYDAGVKNIKKGTKTPPAAPDNLKKSEEFRKKYTPSIMQSAIDKLAGKKKPNGK